VAAANAGSILRATQHDIMSVKPVISQEMAAQPCSGRGVNYLEYLEADFINKKNDYWNQCHQ
jgi:hypothetical protein